MAAVCLSDYTNLVLIAFAIIGTSLSVPQNCSSLKDQGAFDSYILQNSLGVEARFIRYGATMTHFITNDVYGNPRDIVLGFDDPTQYCANAQHPYFGAAIGRVANRIANCSFYFDGKLVSLPCNENSSGHQDTLHGGPIGYDRQVWDVVHYDGTSVIFQYFSENGDNGFPGSLNVRINYTLDANSTSWLISYSATAGPQNTVVALSQHSYWNLDGFIHSETVLNNTLWMADASQYLPVDVSLIPTGAIDSVLSAPWLDFTEGKEIGKDISQGTVTPNGGYDNAFVFTNWTAGQVAQRAVLSSTRSGISLIMSTDQPSVQFYSGNFLDGTLPRKASQCTAGPCYYPRYSAAVLEAQHFPDSVHHSNFPSIELQAGATYKQTTVYSFAVIPPRV